MNNTKKKLNNENWTNSVQNKLGIQKEMDRNTDNGAINQKHAVTSATAQKRVK